MLDRDTHYLEVLDDEASPIILLPDAISAVEMPILLSDATSAIPARVAITVAADPIVVA